MSFNNIKTRMQAERGFTIVELLIVIVVIGILAAITIVSFNGVTARANTANAQSAAESMIKKVEAYNAEASVYPTSALTTVLASANSSSSYYLTGVTLPATTTTSAYTTKPGSASTVNFFACGASAGTTTTAPTTIAGIAVPTGAQVSYWDYQANNTVTMSTGTTSGTISNNGVTKTVACLYNAN